MGIAFQGSAGRRPVTKAIAICWPDKSKRLAAIGKSGAIPSFCLPRQVAIAGTKLALVAPSGRIQLLCTLQRAIGPKRVRVADGRVRINGYELIARRESVRVATSGYLGDVGFRWRALGQLRYFDWERQRPLTIGTPEPGGKFLSGSGHEDAGNQVQLIPFSAGIAGEVLNRPEYELIQRYIRWVGGADHFFSAKILRDGTIMDLFNTTRWTLFEAKCRVDDRAIREAFGQVHDYRRLFTRGPSVALLLPAKPRRRLLTFLEHFAVGAVWESTTGEFRDSRSGRYTHELRDEYRRRVG